MNNYGNVILKNGDTLLGNPKYQAFCYGGYRNETRKDIPTIREFKEDLLILEAMNIKILRTYNTAEFTHAEALLKAIRELKLEKPEFEMYVMLGAWVTCKNAHKSNVNHNLEDENFNKKEIIKAIELARDYEDIVKIIAVGNEAMVDWQVHYVKANIILKWVNHLIKARENELLPQDILITCSDNFAPWGGEDKYKNDDLVELIKAVDYISLHTYPFHDTYHKAKFWQISEDEKKLDKKARVEIVMKRALEYAKSQYKLVEDYVKELGIEKPIHIGETGWATVDDSIYGEKGTKAADEFKGKLFYEQMREWTNQSEITCFYFAAFDERWKDKNKFGSENHFGQFTIEGKAKYSIWDLVDEGIFRGLKRDGNEITKTYDGDEKKLLEDIL